MSKYGHRTGHWHEAIVNKLGGELIADAFLRGEYELTKVARSVKPALLKLIGTVVVPATTGIFVAKKKFVRDTSRKAKVRISYPGDNFKTWFLNDDGKTEDSIIEQTLRYHKVWKSSADGPIIAELGGEESAETTLPLMFALMEKQGKGEDGVLLTNDYANIFYIKDNAGVLRTVRVNWVPGGWDVDASSLSVERSCEWHTGLRVFSRN